ncbi:ATP-binding protein [Actinomadura scrupuli]|uniref:ATP-binding protein n=1 Tax=Actinomadura scrupuli TaxID=559629 RepID=UPI003D97958C
MTAEPAEPAVLGSITLPGVTRSAACARRFTRDVLGPEHPSLHDVRTCVSEGVTNAVLHTASGRGGTVTVTFRAAGGMIVTEVTDDGAGGARPYVRDEPSAVHGRGLRIIDALTLAWGFRADGDRTTVWMRFPGPVPAVPGTGGSELARSPAYTSLSSG